MRQTPIKVRELWNGYSSFERSLPQPPSISIVLPTYRRARSGLLHRSVQSVLQQSFRQYELIVIDDGSQDGSADYLRSMAEKDPRLRYYRFPRNSGLPAVAVDFGILQSRAPVIAFMFDDDLWYPNALADLHKEISKPCRYIVYGRVRVFCRDSGLIRMVPLGEASSITHADLLTRNVVSNNGVMLRREVLDRVGLYDPHIVIRRVTDWDLWRRATRHFPMFQANTWIGEVWGDTRSESLSRTVRSNRDMTAKYVETERDEALKPDAIGDFVVNDCSSLTSNVSALDMPIIHEMLREYYAQVGDIDNLNMAKIDMCDSMKVDAEPPPALRLLISGKVREWLTQVCLINYLELQMGTGRYSYRFSEHSEIGCSDLIGCDVLVLVGMLDEASASLLRTAKRLERRVLYVVDEDSLELSRESDGRPSFWHTRRGGRTLSNLKRLVTESDAVLVSTDAMQSRLASLNGNMHIVPTNIPERYLRNRAEDRKCCDRITIGYVRTRGRGAEQEFVVSAIRQLPREVARKVTLELWGEGLHDVSCKDVDVTYRPMALDYRWRLFTLCHSGLDIIMAPDIGTSANDFGSCLKYLETVAANAAGVYSKTTAYARVVRNGETGLLVSNTPSDWAGAIVTLVEDEELRQKIIEKSRDDVMLNHTSEITMLKFNAILETIGPRKVLSYPGLFLRMSEVFDRAGSAIELVGLPGARLIAAGQLFRPIKFVLVWVDGELEMAARILKIRKR